MLGKARAVVEVQLPGTTASHQPQLVRKQSEPRFEQVSSSWICPIFYPNSGSLSSSLNSCAVRLAHLLCLPSSR